MPNLFKNAGNLSFSESVKIPDSSKHYYEEKTQDQASDIDENQEEIELTEDENLDSESELIKEEVVKLSRAEIIANGMKKEDLLEIFSEEFKEVELAVSKNAYKEAYQQGYEDAYTKTVAQRKGEIQECIKRVDDAILEMQDIHKAFLKEYSYELKYFAIDIAEKMICQKIEENDAILSSLVKKTVLDIKNTAWFDIEISDKLVDLVDILRKDLEKAMPNTRITISPKAIPIDSCRVNTSEGTVVSGISTQAENLKKIFNKNDEEN